MTEISREEHLAVCKQRALEYLDDGDAKNAVASMISDLGKHSAWRGSTFLDGMSLIGMFTVAEGDEPVRKWIEGFN